MSFFLRVLLAIVVALLLTPVRVSAHGDNGYTHELRMIAGVYHAMGRSLDVMPLGSIGTLRT